MEDPYDVTPEEVLAAFPPGHFRDFWLEWAMQLSDQPATAWTSAFRSSHHSRVRVLTHIKKLDDCFGDFLVRVTCQCGAVHEVTPESLAGRIGWQTTLARLAQRMRCSQCGRKAAEVVAVNRPRRRGVPKNPH